MRTAAVILAAGRGERFGGPKILASLGGKPALWWSCQAFRAHPAIDEVIVVLPGGIVDEPPEWLAEAGIRRCRGGSSRRESAGSGVAEADATDLILIHDGARPFASPDLIDEVLEAARSAGAALPVLALSDTIKRQRAGKVVETVDRAELGRAQTPQAFAAGLIREVHDWAARRGVDASDDAALCEMRGYEVAVVPGDPWNLKITTRADLDLAEWLVATGRVRAPAPGVDPSAAV